MAGEQTPILYLAPWVDLGGSDKGTIDWFRHIDRERWAPSLITTQPSRNRWLHQVEPFAEEVWELPDLMPGSAFPEFILGFIESRGVRLVHVMNSRLGFDLLPDIACLPNPPAVVAQMHAEEPNRAGYVRYAARRYGNLIDAFSVSSDHLKRAIAAYDIPPSRIELIHTGVDGEGEFNPERTEPLPDGPNGVPRVLWPGRLVEQKDPLLTLEVLARARASGLEFTLQVVGDGHLETALKRRAGAIGVADAIEWHPPSQEIARWYRGADLTLMTSAFEGVPYVVYESLAMAVPVVAPALPGNVELMDEDSGALIEPRDDAARYVEAIAALLADDERRRAMGERSRARMLSDFSLARMGRSHDALYERLLSSRPASSRWRVDDLRGDHAGGGLDSAPAPPEPLRLPRKPAPERSVGVIVPCYRHGIFLAECIDSIRAQTLPPARVIVVDDGSDDPETIEALGELERDPELTVLRQAENRGPSAARNRALAELETSYVLPLDADDQLLPHALERMVAQLEAAPEDVGFVYPHTQHIGNRSDYAEMPAYNLWLLMEENYCPAPALFDRRVFERGDVAYPEEIVVGHEDWDLILQLGERGIRGMHADGPTFRYRRQGFSRINAVNYGPHSFQESIERRHPLLYLNRDRIKARWAPAVSVVLHDAPGEEWTAEDLRDLPAQTCGDFETVAREELSAGGREVETTATPGSPAWLQAAIGAARGRWVCLLTPRLAPALRDRSLVERLLYGFWANEDSAAIVLAEAPAITRNSFAQLDDEERLAAQPVGVVFERPPEARLPKVALGHGETLLADLVLGLQVNGPVQWRTAPLNPASPADLGGAREAVGGGEPGALDVNRGKPADRSEALAAQKISWQEPRLPSSMSGGGRRWNEEDGWTPPETQPLFRHVALHGEPRRLLTHDRQPPRGYALEFELGVVHRFGAPGTRRLIATGHGYELSDDQNELNGGRRSLGYIEQAPLPMLAPLELRRLPRSGELVTVAGGDDPLLSEAEPIETLGWIEPFPILPRGDLLHTGPWGLATLRRHVDLHAWRHRYDSGPVGDRVSGVSLGALYGHPAEGLVALRRRDDGRLVSDLARPGRASRDPRKIGAWVAAPLSWNGHTPPDGSGRVTRARLGHLARRYSDRRLTDDGGVTLGWLRREPARGCSPLVSSTHPVTGDQFVTCNADEAVDLGFLPDGVLGFICDSGADRALAGSPSIPWAEAPGEQRLRQASVPR